MKLGFDNRREVLLMAVVVLIAIAAVWRYVSQPAVVQTASKAPAAKGNSPATAQPAARGRNRPWVLPKDLQPTLDPSLKLDLLSASESTEYEGGKRNIFREYVEPAPVVKATPPQPGPVTPVRNEPPPPPPIPLKYYGFANKPGEPRKVFLANGDEVFVAEEGQVIQRRYKIGKITATSVEVEDVLNNNKQTIPLTQG